MLSLKRVNQIQSMLSVIFSDFFKVTWLVSDKVRLPSQYLFLISC